MSDQIDSLSDLQNVDLSGVDTSFPVIAPGAYRFKVADVQVVPNKNKDGNNFVVKLTLDQLVMSVPDAGGAAREISPGFPLTHLISMKPTEKYDQSAINRNLAGFQEAVLGRKGSLLPLTQYVGLDVTCQVKVEESAEFGKQNRVSRFVKKG